MLYGETVWGRATVGRSLCLRHEVHIVRYNTRGKDGIGGGARKGVVEAQAAECAMPGLRCYRLGSILSTVKPQV